MAWLRSLAAELRAFSSQSAEQARLAEPDLFGAENSLKAFEGRLAALRDAGFWRAKEAAEKQLRARVESSVTLKKEAGKAWRDAAAALDRGRTAESLLIDGRVPASFKAARFLLRAGAELKKPDASRLSEYAEARLSWSKRNLLQKAISPELERIRLQVWLSSVREGLGPQNALVKKLLAGKTPEQRATELAASKLLDVSERLRLLDDPASLDSSRDPLLLLAAAIEPESRSLRQWRDAQTQALDAVHATLARARFALDGPAVAPDGTFTPRLSYGAVSGYSEGGKQVKPITTFAGLFERATGRAPFELPGSWTSARDRLDLSTPLDFASSNDITGGNSGSPVFNRELQIVGLVFDGNRQSLGGEYQYDGRFNRAVSVHSAGLLAALDRVYGARRIVDELRVAPETAVAEPPPARAPAAADPPPARAQAAIEPPPAPARSAVEPQPAAPAPAPIALKGKLAVLDLKNFSRELTRENALYFTAVVRGVTLEVEKGIDVITRENLLTLLQSTGRKLEDCEGECEVETGRRIGADLIVSGEIQKVGTRIKMTLRLHRTADGKLLGTAIASGHSVDELDEDAQRAAHALFTAR